MIIVRSPLRIPICGGGTDLPSYYTKFGSMFISAAINKYVYVGINENFRQEFLLKYSQVERTENVESIQHQFIREAIKYWKNENNISPLPYYEIICMADVPEGTGMGSSGSFSTALLYALYLNTGINLKPKALAEKAFLLEAEILKNSSGKQDQYTAAFGGVKLYGIDINGDVICNDLPISDRTRAKLESNLVLFFTGYSRTASDILKEQADLTNENNLDMVANLHWVRSEADDILEYLIDEDFIKFSDCLNRHWEHKKTRSSKMTNSFIDEIYSLGMNNGAWGGKLVGAGGGGFMLFYSEGKDKENLCNVVQKELNIRLLKFEFDYVGTIKL